MTPYGSHQSPCAPRVAHQRCDGAPRRLHFLPALSPIRPPARTLPVPVPHKMNSPSDRPARQKGRPAADSQPPRGGAEHASIASGEAECDQEDRPTLVNPLPSSAFSSARAAESPEAYDVLADLIDKAVAVGNVNAIACNVAARLAQFATRSSENTAVLRQTVDAASRCALKLVTATGDASWIAVVVRLYLARGEILPARLVDMLYSMLRHASGVEWRLLERYVEFLRGRKSRMTPADRFVVNRIEGLLQLG